MRHKPPEVPKWPHRFLKWFCCEEQIEILEGDLHELFYYRIEEKGRIKARLYFLFDVLDLIRPFAFKKNLNRNPNHYPMFKNHLKVAYRNFIRQRAYSTINLAGLAIGLACFILISLYIFDELTYDRFHAKSHRIYRLVEHFESEGIGEHSASQPFPVAEAIVNDFPGQVEAAVRLFNFQSPSLSVASPESKREFNEKRVFFADVDFFKVFDFELLQGDEKTALLEPNGILLTESMSKKYFGDLDPMGKTLQFQGTENYIIRGILADTPLNSHFQFDFLISFSSVDKFFNGRQQKGWYWNPCWTYVLLNENNDTEALSAQFPDFVSKYFPPVVVDDVSLELQALEDIHLKSKLDYEIQPNGDENNIYIFSAVPIFVLLIAGINFVNLSTARSTKRAKEVGVRKALGSKRIELINQFMVESLLLTFVAIIISIVLVAVVLPYFNVLTGKHILLAHLMTPFYGIGLFVLGLVVGGLSGVYPAFVLSSFRASKVLKSTQATSKGLGFRQILVVAQFSISMILIIGTGIALDQLNLLQNDEVGFEKEQVLMVPVIRTPMATHFATYKEKVLQNTRIQSVTCVEEIIGAKHQVGNYQFQGMERSLPFPRLFVRHDFVHTMGIELAAGRSYGENFQTDDSLALLVNETLVRQMGWGSNEEALGKSFGAGNRKIVGVVKDFNFLSKHHTIKPIVLDLNTNPRAFNLFIKYMAVRVDQKDLPESIATLRSTWKEMMPDRPFDYFFLDDKLNDSYAAETKLSGVTKVFSFLAILVACLGLFGLATFATEQRTKEIGIRKVLGIKSGQLILLLSRQFMLLILIAFTIAIPLGYALVAYWLDSFAYRVTIGWEPFVLSGVVTFLIAMITVGYHSLRASNANPVEALKYE